MKLLLKRKLVFRIFCFATGVKPYRLPGGKNTKLEYNKNKRLPTKSKLLDDNRTADGNDLNGLKWTCQTAQGVQVHGEMWEIRYRNDNKYKKI